MFMAQRNDIDNSHNYSTELVFHSVNVAKIAKLIGIEMNLNIYELELLYELALLHDIGKSEVPQNILYKPGQFNSHEWDIMKSHAIHSEKIFYKKYGLNQYGKIIRGHHENFDGTGYPDGLKGEEIPLLTRIITIADIFDAITSSRVYRKHPIDKPLEILDSERFKKIDGRIYDKYARKVLERLLEK